jgi:hypothetical protein
MVNESAARSLEEGLEETLPLHRLGIVPELGVSFRTTNLIESVELTRFGGRVTAWVSSRLLHRRSGCRGDAFVGHRGLLPQG